MNDECRESMIYILEQYYIRLANEQADISVLEKSDFIDAEIQRVMKLRSKLLNDKHNT